MSSKVILKKSAPWKNNLIVDRNFNSCKIHASILFYKCWYNNTEINKNKKEQVKSKKSLKLKYTYTLMLAKRIKALFLPFL